MPHIKNILEITADKNLEVENLNKPSTDKITQYLQKQFRYLGSAQNDVLSSSGTTNVRFKRRATVTISHI